ncbi:uncharacterized protein N7479_008051 [Penicillium vulpinum]|uniref:Methyltransferase type 11 domain-containing protein n=1 Tax=Penicillium vulpinum TaxID=29845 RepID=A0A1V6RBV2_9EURO|nr:uncharacterized protein N7479_008051 [Penicillium vulpinum]KAJ5960901.1 hypothetical protein N7479_008051 [Penicillium vulpinum]OQD99025.1 hypothetical protein PENVUL_c066G04110 [Penicillium vulpinum]
MSHSTGHHMPQDSSSNLSRTNAGAYGRPPRSQIARPFNPNPKSRTSSVSDVEDTGPVLAPSSIKRSISRGSRLSMLPRPSIGNTTSPTTPVSASSSQNSTQTIPSSFSSPEINKTSPPVAGQQLAPKRARNVLRRRAPTIGKHVEQLHSDKLSLVIPQEPHSLVMNNATGNGNSASSLSEQSASSYRPNHKNESNVAVNSVRSRFNGPEELASLRTTVDTQNLPTPPTPFLLANSPSTRYSGSPSIWSRGSTPTSLSSYSPGITKIGRLRQPSPSQTRLPVFSPPPPNASPQQGRLELKTSKRVPPTKLSGPSVVGTSKGQSVPSKPPSAVPQGPACSPPPRKSSVNFSPSKAPKIDVEQARREVEEAERNLFYPQRAMECSPAGNVETPQTPPRPSRDGTHRLQLETSPIVQSNLRYLRTTGHTRRESIENVLATQPPHPTSNQSAAASMDSLQSRSISQVPSRDGGSPVLSKKTPRALTKVTSKEKTDSKQIPIQKRFGLFPKKSKPEMSENLTDQARSTRKGPAAGTGHEGYGKYGQRGRKASGSSSSGTRTRSTSTTRSATSKGSQSSRPELDIDDFLLSRLEPVIINGGGLDGASLSRTQSEQSFSSISVASTSNLPRQTMLSYSTSQSTESLATSTGTFGETITPLYSNGIIKPMGSKSPESQSKAIDRPTALKSRMPVPKGKRHDMFANPQAAVTNTSLPSHEPSTAASQQPKSVQKSPEKMTKPEQAEKQAKKGKASMWSFFQKNRANEQKTSNPPATSSQTAKLHAAISPVINTRPVAHYALVDADSDELDEIINNVEDSPPTEEETIFHPVEIPRGLSIRKRKPSILLPSPPKMHGEFENDDRPSPRTAMFNRNLMGPELETSPEQRPRRLASIGRIPPVVSRRDRNHHPAMQSFSRPFSVAESPSITVPTTQSSYESPPVANVPLNLGIGLSESSDWGHGFNPTFSAAEQTSALEFLAGPFTTYDFLQFPPKKGSTSSDSSGALAAVTAVAPVPGSPPTEDEVWNEYDDLIDHVLSPDEPKTEEPGKTKEDDRFELATMASRALQDELNNANHPQPVPADNSLRSSGSSVHLRRSQIISALHSSTAPSSQPSYSDLTAVYRGSDEEKTQKPAGPPEHASSTDQRREQQSTFLNSLAAVPSPRPKFRREQEAASPEREWDEVTRTNMRSASLMTSRWLSFGRVLFSPAHNHVKAGCQGRILVVDGLGNDDWSFYCSLTYPDAEVYSLSGRPVFAAPPHPAAWQPPNNHHTVYHAGLDNPLPFPKDYFSVAVLRFPTICSESVQGNIIQECKRVLRTGGYLEMSLLDRDMVNMGPHTRKAIRQLKEMTCLSDPTLSLKPTSDSVQRELGTQGFDSLRRCMVRIPVAGMVVRSSDSSSSAQSISTATPSTTFSVPTISVTTEGGSQSTGTTSISKSASNDANVSLGDLLSDPSPSPANDESIAKIVARVGRWWYSKCYEDPILSNRNTQDPSIWNDRKVLRECQKRGTGFRMFIAYAQKPSEVPRRTASV